MMGEDTSKADASWSSVGEDAARIAPRWTKLASRYDNLDSQGFFEFVQALLELGGTGARQQPSEPEPWGGVMEGANPFP